MLYYIIIIIILLLFLSFPSSLILFFFNRSACPRHHAMLLTLMYEVLKAQSTTGYIPLYQVRFVNRIWYENLWDFTICPFI